MDQWQMNDIKRTEIYKETLIMMTIDFWYIYIFWIISGIKPKNIYIIIFISIILIIRYFDYDFHWISISHFLILFLEDTNWVVWILCWLSWIHWNLFFASLKQVIKYFVERNSSPWYMETIQFNVNFIIERLFTKQSNFNSNCLH